MTDKHKDLWVQTFDPRPGARLRLFCFPYEGGSASLFRGWGRTLSDEVEVCAVEPPGLCFKGCRGSGARRRAGLFKRERAFG